MKNFSFLQFRLTSENLLTIQQTMIRLRTGLESDYSGACALLDLASLEFQLRCQHRTAQILLELGQEVSCDKIHHYFVIKKLCSSFNLLFYFVYPY